MRAWQMFTQSQHPTLSSIKTQLQYQDYMKDHKLLTTACNCLTCTKPMEMVTRPLSSTSDGFGWRCTNQRCPKRHTYRTIRTGSFFEKSRVPIGKWLYKCISSTYGVTKPKQVEIGEKTVIQMYQYTCTSVMSAPLSYSPIQLGSQDVVKTKYRFKEMKGVSSHLLPRRKNVA